MGGGLGGGGAGWALGIQSRHRGWAGLTFFSTAGQEGTGGGREAGAGWDIGGGGGNFCGLATGEGRGAAKSPSPIYW